MFYKYAIHLWIKSLLCTTHWPSVVVIPMSLFLWWDRTLNVSYHETYLLTNLHIWRPREGASEFTLEYFLLLLFCFIRVTFWSCSIFGKHPALSMLIPASELRDHFWQGSGAHICARVLNPGQPSARWMSYPLYYHANRQNTILIALKYSSNLW